MTLHPPFEISGRLLPAVRVGDATISIKFDGQTRDGRTRYRWFIDAPGVDATGNDLCSGVGGGSIQEGMASLLSFLSACGESYGYQQSHASPYAGTEFDGDGNAGLFPLDVAAWAYQKSDELSLLEWELSENPNLVTP